MAESTDPLKQLLGEMLTQMQAVSFGLRAPENVALSPTYAGRQLTKKQLAEFHTLAAAAESDIYAALRAQLAALPPSRIE